DTRSDARPRYRSQCRDRRFPGSAAGRFRPDVAAKMAKGVIACPSAAETNVMYPWVMAMGGMQRKRSIPVDVGGVTIGGAAPVVVQSMTNTDTADIAGTVAQVAALHR